jgi:hypothetical protein
LKKGTKRKNYANNIRALLILCLKILRQNSLTKKTSLSLISQSNAIKLKRIGKMATKNKVLTFRKLDRWLIPKLIQGGETAQPITRAISKVVFLRWPL